MKLLLFLCFATFLHTVYSFKAEVGGGKGNNRVKPKYNERYTYEDFQVQFGRNYEGKEREAHKRAFNKKYREIQKLRKDPTIQYDVQVNEYDDWLPEQLNAFMNFKPDSNEVPTDEIMSENFLRSVALPEQFDYRTKGKVTSVKYQKNCGSCWAFVATAMYESALLIHNQGYHDLSEQKSLQCTMYSSCSGGYPKFALRNMETLGLPTQSKFPYQNNDKYYPKDNICQPGSVKLTNNIQDIKTYYRKGISDIQLKQWLYDFGPIGVGVKSSDYSFSNYGGGGVMTGCATTQYITHVVLLVGWTKKGWKIKNSWGTNWGDEGYAEISYTANCGISSWVDVLQVQPNQDSSNNVQVVEIINDPEESEQTQTTDTTTDTTDTTTDTTDTTQTTDTTTDTTDTTTDTTDTTNPIQHPNQTYSVAMTDQGGDGWNGYVFTIRQQYKSIVVTFGSTFTVGASHGPQQIDIPTGYQTSIVVAQAGLKSEEIGFQIKDSSGKTVCKRSPQIKFADDIIFCTFCKNCNVSKISSYSVTLRDAGSNGWEGTVLAFRQDGVLTKFGQGFTSGSFLGLSINLLKGMTTQIIVYKMGQSTNEISYTIRDLAGNIIAIWNGERPISADEILATFCTMCVNEFPVNQAADQISGQNEQYQQGKSISEASTTGYVVAIVVLSLFLAISLLVTLYLLYMRKINKNSKVLSYNPPSSAQSLSIMNSTGQIPVVISSGNISSLDSS